MRSLLFSGAAVLFLSASAAIESNAVVEVIDLERTTSVVGGFADECYEDQWDWKECDMEITESYGTCPGGQCVTPVASPECPGIDPPLGEDAGSSYYWNDKKCDEMLYDEDNTNGWSGDECNAEGMWCEMYYKCICLLDVNDADMDGDVTDRMCSSDINVTKGGRKTHRDIEGDSCPDE